MKKQIALLILTTILITGCSTTPSTDDLSKPPVSPNETTDSTNQDNLIKPALESLYQSAEDVILAGPESEVTEEEFSQRVEALIEQLEMALRSHSYEGNEFLDNQLVALLNSTPERHEGMGPKTYQEYYDLVMPIAQELINWEGMIGNTLE